jgi:uncharacterized membrane protein
MTVKETHLRTLYKTVAYRILSTLAIMAVSLLLGASGAQAGAMGIIIFVLGSIIYYAHDRVWARLNWNRGTTGNEAVKRSVIKTIVYRLITVVVGMIIARLVMTDSNTTALAFGVSQFVVNMILYYVLERVFNRVQYGRVVTEE